MKNITIKLFLTFCILLIKSSGFCANIPVKNINKVAINFMFKNGETKTIASISNEQYSNVIVYYKINFNEGGWVLISNSNQTIPVLGYSKNGEFNTESLPPALEQLLNYYRSSIYKVITNNVKSSDFNKEWELLLNYQSNKSTKSTQTNNFCLLNKPSEGTVYWGQEFNNDGGCDPSYNKFCPGKTVNTLGCTSLSSNSCNCDKKPVGCAAVAMAEIMWFWQWPVSYNWSIIPTELRNTTPSNQADALATLLRDCGNKANMNFCCKGSWATTNNVCDGLIDLGFESAQVKIRNQLNSSAWKQLLRTELDAERPVLYRGGEVIDPGDWGNVHYFVCDGYDRDNPDYFHFNWGWGYTYASDCSYGILFTLDDLCPETGYDYSSSQQMIIGISPTCTQISQNILSVPYSQVFDTKLENASNNITLPANGASLSVEPNGNYTLVAGNSIDLKPGFHAKSGSYFHAYLSEFSCNCGGDLNVPTWYNFLSPNGDGYNDELCFYVYNGNTYEVNILDNNSNIIYQGSGAFTNDFACVWDGTGDGGGDYCFSNGSFLYCPYRAIIIFRNNCGQITDNDYFITVAYPLNKAFQDSVSKKESIQYFNNLYNNFFNLYPNPNNGIFTLTFNESPEQFNISIINSIGNVIYERESSFFPLDIDISIQPQGIYYLKVLSKNHLFLKKIIKL